MTLSLIDTGCAIIHNKGFTGHYFSLRMIYIISFLLFASIAIFRKVNILTTNKHLNGCRYKIKQCTFTCNVLKIRYFIIFCNLINLHWVCFVLHVSLYYPIKNYRGLSPNYRGERWAYVHLMRGAAIIYLSAHLRCTPRGLKVCLLAHFNKWSTYK